MAFLDESVGAKSVQRKVADHSVLLKAGMHLNDRVLYLKGVVLAALLDDAEISVEESSVIKHISHELELTDEVTAEAFEIKSDLSDNPALQNEFLDELYSILNTKLRKDSFVADVETLFFEDGKIKQSVEKYYRRLCINLYGREWEKDFNSRMYMVDHPIAGRVADSCGRLTGYLARTNLGYLIRRAIN